VRVALKSPSRDEKLAWRLLPVRSFVFVRNRELFAQQPFSISTDEPFTDELTELITRLAIGGLLHASAAA